jgi:hypothetical protein
MLDRNLPIKMSQKEQTDKGHRLDDKSASVIAAKDAFEKLVTDQKEHPGHPDQKSFGSDEVEIS